MTSTSEEGHPRTAACDAVLYTYRYAVRRGELLRCTAAADVGLTAAEAHEAIERLVVVGMLRPWPTDPDRLFPVSPETASSERLGPMRRDLRRREQVLARMSMEIDAFLPAYLRGIHERHDGQGFEVLTDPAAIQGVLTEEAGACREEVLTVQPGGPRRVEILAEAAERDRAMLQRGVRMKTLYQHTARFSRSTLAHVEAMVALGAEVRTIGALPPRLIVFDRATAVIPDHADGRHAVVIRQHSVIEFLVASFATIWPTAEPLVRADERELQRKASAEIDRAIVRLLVTGAKDEVIAKRLGTSLRTCRRRISVVLEQLGASSRFQAGYLVHRLGIDPPADPRP